jgi:alpha-galactosidase
MKKHDVNYHEHDDLISFYHDHCNHFEASKRSFSNQSTKKKNFFSKKIFSDQSKLIENKEIKIFLEKTNNSSKIILKRLIIVEFNEKLIERSKRLIESHKKLNERRRINES